jgi:hypothetical protein
MRHLLISVCLFFAASASFAQSGPHTARSASSISALAKPRDCGTYTVRMFPDSRRISFGLITSWIPGENHKGMLRYRLTAFPERPSPTDDPNDAALAETTENLMRQVFNSCTVIVDVNDSDDFLLRKISAPLGLGVDDQGHVRALNANDAVQMDAKDYRAFLAGSWNIAWNCSTP